MVVQSGYPIAKSSSPRMANPSFGNFNSNGIKYRKSSFSCMDLTQVSDFDTDVNGTNDFRKNYSRDRSKVQDKLSRPKLKFAFSNNDLRVPARDSRHSQLHTSKSSGNGRVKAGLTLYPLTDVDETELDGRVNGVHQAQRQCQSASEIRDPTMGFDSHSMYNGQEHEQPQPPSHKQQDGQKIYVKKNGYRTNSSPYFTTIDEMDEYLARSKRHYDQFNEDKRKDENDQEMHNNIRYYKHNNNHQQNHLHNHLRLHACQSVSSSTILSSSSRLYRHPSISRSKSETNVASLGSCSTDDLSEDDDGDDYGFLSWSSTHLSTAMQKAKSPLPTRRIIPKRWRSKSKAVSSVSTLWSSEGSCTWCSMSGRRVTLKGTTLLQLSEKERLALQKIALSKFQSINLGCPVDIPKETTQIKRGKRVLKMLKRKSHSANLSTLLDNLKENHVDKDTRECQPMGLVFGIPLSKCVANDIELQKRRLSRPDATPLSPHQRKSSNSSINSYDSVNHNGNLTDNREQAKNRAVSTESLSESESGKHSTSLLDALSLSLTSHHHSSSLPLKTSQPQVPRVVKTCFKHLETYGLRILGIFRVGSTKKRTKQIRDEFDSGKDVKLGEHHNPNDVAALLKEYFRDLPEPLLTRDLYSPFVATRNIYQSSKQALAVKMLVALLPVPNRDTLWALLCFLNKVVEHSTDSVDQHGQLLPGNKMDSHNLATLFGPNVLHKAKMGVDKQFLVEDVHRAEERSEVIAVLEDMIDFFEDTYNVPAELQDKIVHHLMETDPDTADDLLKRLASEYGIEPDPDTTSSSVFDDSDTSSIPHSPSIDTELALHSRRGQSRPHHAMLRPVQSADPVMSVLTGVDRLEVPRLLHSERDSMDDNATKSSSARSPKPHRSPRMPKLKVSHEKSSTNTKGKPGHIGSGDNYWSDPYAHDLLTVPSLEGRRKSSSSLTSPEASPVGSESSGQWLMTTGSSSSGGTSRSSSPRAIRHESPRHYHPEPPSPRRHRTDPRTDSRTDPRTDSNSNAPSSSQQRPLILRQRTQVTRQPEDSRSEDVDLETRLRLRRWEREQQRLAAQKDRESHEQETLV